MRLRAVLGLVLVLAAIAGISALATQGPFADTIVFDVRMTEEIPLQDVAAGYLDAFWYPTPAAHIYDLAQPVLDSLELYIAPFHGDAILLNPYPNAAPYIAADDDDGKETFNPFAIRAVRFAMNQLISRDQICDEILHGGAEPRLTPLAPGLPGAYRATAVATALGITDQGDETAAIAAITTAIEAAAALPSMAGRLTKQATSDSASQVGFWWAFEGQPVTLLALVRVDDPYVRLPLGRYIIDQIMKCGIQVQELDRPRAYVASTVYHTDPARMLWHLCTEELDATDTSAWREEDVSRSYSTWFAGLYPGGNSAGGYSFVNPRSEEVTQRLVLGNFATLDEYWALMVEAVRLGLEDAVRIHLAQELGFFVANRFAFEDRFLYGLDDGLNKWSAYTMRPTSPDRPVRVTQYSSLGTLFANPWDPVGLSGFADCYGYHIIEPCTDPLAAPAPGSGVYTPVLAQWSDIRVAADTSGDRPAGAIVVPAEAVSWDSGSRQWLSRGGETSCASAVYSLTPAPFHDGTSLTLLDLAAAEGFRAEWAYKDFPDDSQFEAGYAAAVAPRFQFTHGSIYDYAKGQITTYFDGAIDDTDRLASAGMPALWASAVDHGQGVKWTVVEALGRMVASGTSKSGTTYGFTERPGVQEVDVLRPSCAADIRAELEHMRDEEYVPPYLVQGMAEMGLAASDIADMYQKAIEFIDTYGHAYISNGGYVLTEFDPANNEITLSANRSPSYPFTGQGWLDLFEVDVARIDDVRVPVGARCGQDVTVEIAASQGLFPYDVFEPATTLDIQLAFVGKGGMSTAIAATHVGHARYSATIPGSLTEGLPSGSYAVITIATPAEGMPVALQSWLTLVGK